MYYAREEDHTGTSVLLRGNHLPALQDLVVRVSSEQYALSNETVAIRCEAAAVYAQRDRPAGGDDGAHHVVRRPRYAPRGHWPEP